MLRGLYTRLYDNLKGPVLQSLLEKIMANGVDKDTGAAVAVIKDLPDPAAVDDVGIKTVAMECMSGVLAFAQNINGTGELAKAIMEARE